MKFVCTRWMELAPFFFTKFPALWCHVVVSFRIVSPPSPPHPLSRVVFILFLARSYINNSYSSGWIFEQLLSRVVLTRKWSRDREAITKPLFRNHGEWEWKVGEGGREEGVIHLVCVAPDTVKSCEPRLSPRLADSDRGRKLERKNM